MSDIIGRNGSLVRMHNIQVVLNRLRQFDAVSRAELAESTALSSTTITHLVDELLAQGIVIEDMQGLRSANENGPRRVGRPRTELRLNPDARYVVGVHIGIGILRAAVVNLRAEIIHNEIADFDISQPALSILKQIRQLIQRTIRESHVDVRRLIGVGIGASGLVDFDSGVNVFAPNLGWRDVPLREWMRAHLQIPVVVDNNVRAMALGESLFGAGQNVGVLAFVYGRVGVGAGFVVDGRLFRGSGAGAGEIGHTVMLVESLEGVHTACRDAGRASNCCCLEALVSERALIREAERVSREQPGSILAKRMAHQNKAKLVESIFAAAAEGDPGALALIQSQARYLGIALANLVNVLNPELILLGGLFAQGSQFFLPTVESTVREYAFAGLGSRVRVQPTRFGWRAGVIGAASLALSAFFYHAEEVSCNPSELVSLP